ncbi:putative component of anaerobic dehydrogenase [Desulfitobacterium dichloroeliminans LMG P-21439]|uniref:Putative component of anaerobic dehydrogenase n=1 Tax=Desulfitobacterium dichloroeliminans (strain LMG P-21439 / DCA1) TaxID=871963 RepID=L0FCG5_DESDL|nr:molecular chaperone TorD family protein [Desulfitobacterium dichloroeliminans]AGA70705.1 putative component of anaerobic dehydrogenase [Desulfitobacterium dichloroeliminans LMG P-21439]
MIKENSITQIEPLLDTRIFLYDFLRRAFLQEPNPEFLSFLKEGGHFESFPFQEDHEEIAQGVNQLLAFMQEKDLTSSEVLDSLHGDYTRMFIGPDRLPAPLWESAYLHKERLLFQEQTLQVRRDYLKYHLLPKHFMQEADDHLGLELDFMYQLTVRSKGVMAEEKLDELEEIFSDQKDFLENHLLKWVPELTLRINESAKFSFYPGIAKILKGYLALDLEALGELLDITRCVK